ncbi:TRAP transporter small permease subunit [Thalassovita aquimarina]|uniref:TRAP transporter small permease protein n=1 Tax=Thalassovita aquimarina TaxID=2785917 RepID=A0ABS5HU02_9RHOB|nr:TRAP transporter small permease subunit [Thalassovita aquimarina]MBR9652267.1 TRAP transporter small permease subunit [Thalassovita aquimarina]
MQAVFNAVAAIGTVWIFAIMLLIVADVVGRNFLAAPITGVAEISARSVVAIVFLMLPAATLNGTLIRADFLLRGIRLYSRRAVHVLDTLFALIGAVLFVLVAIAAWPDTHEAWVSSEFFGVRGVWTLPTLPFHLLVVLGSGATSIAFVTVAFESAKLAKSEKGH